MTPSELETLLCESGLTTVGDVPDFPDGFGVAAVTEDSRRVVPGTLFVALSGEHTDGHGYAEKAAALGAVAVCGERAGLRELAGLPYITVNNARKTAGIVAHALCGNPSQSLKVIGITGTNGKSSTAYLAQAILDGAGYSAANFGTMGYHIGRDTFPAAHTTPFGEELAVLFAKARDAGRSHVVMEASSHALEQERVAGIDFDAAAFTNLTQDHLDYHQDMDTYCRAKLRLFERVAGPDRFTVVNREDPWAESFIHASHVSCYTFGTGGDCRAEDIQISPGGTSFRFESPWGGAEVRIALLGEHNARNALCAAAICGGLGVSVEAVAEGLAALPSVPGRFEAIDEGQDFLVIVDYAHTEDGLKNVLEAARRVCAGRVITVFGCGGDRDKGKRPKMGATSARLSDFAIATSDNPRTEDPHRILLDVEVGLQRAGKRKGDDYLVIESREEAICEAISRAEPGDLVMIAGKGHEDYQILGDRRIHFDDREVARAALGGH